MHINVTISDFPVEGALANLVICGGIASLLRTAYPEAVLSVVPSFRKLEGGYRVRVWDASVEDLRQKEAEIGDLVRDSLDKYAESRSSNSKGKN